MSEKLKRVEKEAEPKNPNAEIAAELLTRPVSDAPDTLRGVYDADQQPIDVVELETQRPNVNILYMSELLVGHKDAAVDFYLDTVRAINELPQEMKPDAAVVSGFLQGDFRHLEKARKATLVPGLTTMNEQFKYAREMLEALQSTGTQVIYNMSDDDRRIAEENTFEVFRKMENYAKGEEGMSWAAQDRMRHNPRWHTHHQFQLTEVFPYCLRNGRQLYSAEEMAELTGGAVAIEEYFLLFNAKMAMEKGEKIPPAYADWLRQVKLQQNNDLIVADDFNLKITTEGREYNDWIRHYMGFSPKPMYQNHMGTAVSAMAQLAANGHETPDMLVTQNNQEEVGVGSQGSWIVSTGGLLRPRNFLSAPGRRTDARGDLSRRFATTRRRIPEPSASIHSRTDDGRHTVTFMNETLREKSYSIPERMTIAELCDFQTGSITARPDILAKYLDYIRKFAMGERSTALFFGGDMIHGRNYPHFPSESQMTGLMAMDSQEAFNVDLFQQAFKDISPDELSALERVLVQPGNHEWNSGTLKWHGYSFTTYMRGLFERMYARAGYSDEEIAERVKSHEATMTQKGEYASGYTGVEYFGDMGVLIQHYLMERGGKGSGGDLPVYQTNHFATGGGDLMKNVDVFMAGHWHHPQYGMFGDKLGIVGGSIAGLSDYELKRGYRPTIAGTMMHIGGGLPPQVEFVSEQALHNHKIRQGGFSAEALEDQGFRDDPDFDPISHGIFLPDSFAKSALQKKILAMMRHASQRADKLSVLR